MEEIFWKWSFLVLLIGWFFIRSFFGKKSLKAGSKNKKRSYLDQFLLFLNIISMIFLPLFVVFTTKLDFASMGLPDIVRWAALIIYALNLVFFVWCHKALGENWSNALEIKKDHKLVQSGPYKRIRHPMYLHFWLLIASQGLLLDNWIVLAYGILAYGILYFLRVAKEEEMMIEEFGEKYKEYMKRTGRLFPKIK